MTNDRTVKSAIAAYGTLNIHYTYIRQNRKLLEIAVHPDGGVVVKAPQKATAKTINARVVKRAGWIMRQKRFFQQFEPRLSPRHYVGGESHLYLGKKYRLKIIRTTADRVVLKEGYFYIACVRNEAAHVRKLLENWYRRRAALYLPPIVEQCWECYAKSGYKKPRVRIQKMKTRWGSLSASGQLTLNLSLMQAPRECIEYVVTHELCHLQYPNHGKDFYRLLEQRMADWRKLKYKLEMTVAMGEYACHSHFVF